MKLQPFLAFLLLIPFSFSLTLTPGSVYKDYQLVSCSNGVAMFRNLVDNSLLLVSQGESLRGFKVVSISSDCRVDVVDVFSAFISMSSCYKCPLYYDRFSPTECKICQKNMDLCIAPCTACVYIPTCEELGVEEYGMPCLNPYRDFGGKCLLYVVDGFKIQCVRDDDCPSKHCNRKYFACYVDGEIPRSQYYCLTDEDCALAGPNLGCDVITHKCRWLCDPDICGYVTGYLGRCVDRFSCSYVYECKSNDDCPSHKPICFKGICYQCLTSSDCPVRAYCLRGVCTYTGEYYCKSDKDCGYGEHCENGLCLEGCLNDSHCMPGMHCYKGKCVECYSDSHCKPNELCVKNKCELKAKIACKDKLFGCTSLFGGTLVLPNSVHLLLLLFLYLYFRNYSKKWFLIIALVYVLLVLWLSGLLFHPDLIWQIIKSKVDYLKSIDIEIQNKTIKIIWPSNSSVSNP